MKLLRPYLVASIAIMLPAAPASADVLLTDTMSRASRTAAPTATGAQWFTIGPNMIVTYAPNELKSIHATGSGGQLLGYLTTGTSPVSLAVGESVKATFTFSFVGTMGATTGDTTFRIGLFNTGNQRIAADVTTLSSSPSFIYYSGYAAMMSPATSGISIRKRTPPIPGGATVTNQNNLIGTATSIYSGALASGSSQTLQSGVIYTGVLAATRTASGTEFRVSLSGGNLSSYELAYSDTTSPVSTFDAIAFGWSTGVVGANGGLAIKSLQVETDSTAALYPTDPVANPDPGRPFIWVRNSEKSAILAKISAQPWAQSVLTGMINRVAANVASHQADRDAFLRGLPVDWNTGQYRTMTNTSDPNGVRSKSVSKFNAALDGAVLYYLTGEAKYAQLAADVLHNVVKTLLPVAPSTDTGNGGWIIRNDLLLEARVLGTQLPVVYDFIRTFLEGNKVYDVMTGGLADFNYYQTQQYFRTYYQLVCDHGNNTNNWSALESTCMLNNLLALADPTERAAALNIYLVPGTSKQASLKEDYSKYPRPDSIWPESLQYASEVGTIRSAHMVMLERYDPTLNLVDQYPNLPLSLSRISYLRYPNGEQISFGDGGRKTGGEPYFDYEIIYQHAKARGRQDFVAHFGAAIKRGIDSGKYNRAALRAYEDLDMHNDPVQLLWFAAEVPEAGVPQILTTTDQVAHAGITLQRNLSSAGPLYGLMGFVGGAGHTHSHASGMSMELYGAGHVLGAKSGKSTYQSALHENYYRLFASNNTIIVNGASRGEGGWEGVGINTVATAAVEPAVAQAPVSPNHSFTTSSFSDTKGTLAEATQQRTLGIIRTSPTTGYYVDIFRSDSSLANEYHDYIYRNVGDSVALETDSGPLALTSAPTRFASDIGDTTGYQQPGWRYFSDTEVSAATDVGVTANFSAMVTNNWRHMRMYMPGSSGREYARVTSPPIVDAPTPYHTKRAPAVVIRKYGNAWNEPFAAVFEPHLGSAGSGSVKTVSSLAANGVVVGLQVGSTVSGRNLVQYVLSNPSATGVYEDAARGLSFKGRYAVVTDNGDGSGSLYLGEGSSLSFKGNSVASVSGANTQAYVEFTPGQSPVVTSNQPVIVQTPPTITAPGTAGSTFGVAFSVSVTATGQPAPVLSIGSALPPGLQFDAATGILSGTPTAAGNFTVQFVATNSAGSASATTAISIAKAPATVDLQNLEQTYTGQPLAPTAATAPAGLPVVLAFAGGSAPTNAGNYAVTATITSPAYEGSTTGIFVIRKAQATIALSGLDQAYNGTPRTVIASTNPPNLAVAFTYGGSPDVPIYPGDYAVAAAVTDGNYQGTASATLRVTATVLVRRAPTVVSTLAGSVQLVTGENVTLGGSAVIGGDLLVPGTPTVTVSGTPTYGGTIDGTGVATPAGYTVALNNSAMLSHVVRRIDPVALPTVAAPPPPAGTRVVSLTAAGQSAGDFATLKNLTLSSNAGDVAVPPGTYGSFTVSGNSALVLGVAGGTVPTVYNLQSLSVNLLPGAGKVKVVGPVVLTLATGTIINGAAGSSVHPEWLTIRIASGGLTSTGNATVTVNASVIAPNGTVTLNSAARLYGTVIADRLNLNGTSLLDDPNLP